jgi:hypothetical protein
LHNRKSIRSRRSRGCAAGADVLSFGDQTDGVGNTLSDNVAYIYAPFVRQQFEELRKLAEETVKDFQVEDNQLVENVSSLFSRNADSLIFYLTLS